MTVATEWAAHLAYRFGAVVELLRAPGSSSSDSDDLDARQCGALASVRRAGIAPVPSVRMVAPERRS